MVDEEKLNVFIGQMLADLGGASSVAMVRLGGSLGLYELLNAGLQITGVAGSDFPVPLNNTKPWPHWLPLLGPERTLVKAHASGSPYEAWAAGVRSGNVLLSNGPLLEMQVDKKTGSVTASASFFRPLEKLEIVSNGKVIAAVPGDGSLTKLTASARIVKDRDSSIANFLDNAASMRKFAGPSNQR